MCNYFEKKIEPTFLFILNPNQKHLIHYKYWSFYATPLMLNLFKDQKEQYWKMKNNERLVKDAIKNPLDFQIHEKFNIDLKLREPQRQALTLILKYKMNILLDFTPSLGKTLTALLSIVLSGEKRAIVVSPFTALTTWKKEFKVWSSILNDYVIFTDFDKYINFGGGKAILLITYDKLAKKSFLKLFNFSLIIDESHNLNGLAKSNNKKSFRSKRLLEIARRADRILCLTGTPYEKHNVELYTVFRILNPKIEISYHMFGSYFFNHENSFGGITYTTLKEYREKDFNYLVSMFILKADVKDYMDITLPKVKEVMIDYDRIHTAILEEIRRDSCLFDSHQLFYNYYKIATLDPHSLQKKFPKSRLRRIIDKAIITAKEKGTTLGIWTDSVKILESLAEEHDLPVIYGKNTTKKRECIINSEPKILLSQILTGEGYRVAHIQKVVYINESYRHNKNTQSFYRNLKWSDDNSKKECIYLQTPFSVVINSLLSKKVSQKKIYADVHKGRI